MRIAFRTHEAKKLFWACFIFLKMFVKIDAVQQSWKIGLTGLIFLDQQFDQFRSEFADN